MLLLRFAVLVLDSTVMLEALDDVIMVEVLGGIIADECGSELDPFAVGVSTAV